VSVQHEQSDRITAAITQVSSTLHRFNVIAQRWTILERWTLLLTVTTQPTAPISVPGVRA